jgi:hypothetical protein
MYDLIKVCPNHEGAFDCTPFCRICEGDQEYESTGTLPCHYCYEEIDEDVWEEELGMCVECSNKYYEHEDM